MKHLLLVLPLALTSLTVAAQQQEDVTVSKSGNAVTMSNGIVTVKIGSNGRVNTLAYGTNSNLLGSSGIYFDYTSDKNNSLDPSKVEIVKQTADYVEVLYSNTSADLQFQQGYILRKGISGLYTYIIANGTKSSESVNLREARVCTRLGTSFLNGYVDDRMNGKIPSNSDMAEAEKAENTVQDATYRLKDGSIYTKYNWAQYVVNDSVHGLMNNVMGVWNIPCSHEWLNGGPMRQELTVHATSKSPISIQMIQGEHFGAASQSFADGERKLYGPFMIYVNKGTKDKMIADAKAQASLQQSQWPFEWFSNELYPLDRSTVTGNINVTTSQRKDSIQVVLAQPDKDIYDQGKGYIYWGLTDKDGNFSIPHVRKGNYALYAYATAGDVTDELQRKDIVVSDAETSVGTVDWTPAQYEHKLWQIGNNNRRSDGYKYSDTLRAYGLWTLPVANLTYQIGKSVESEDWYYAQTQNGKWTVSFNLDDTYVGSAYLTASIAGATNSPKVTVSVNGQTKDTWSFYNDAAIYRSAVQGGKHTVRTCTFPTSLLKKGQNKIDFIMSGIKNNGGVMWDCIKLEAGQKIISKISSLPVSSTAHHVEVYTLGGQKIGTFHSLTDVYGLKGIYVYRQGDKIGKICF